MNMNINRLLLTISILFLFSYLNYSTIEHFFNRKKIGTCCGNLSPDDFDPNDRNPPYQIRRCIKDYKYNSPCTPIGDTIFDVLDRPKQGYVNDGPGRYVKRNPGICCGGTDQCVPSLKGGKCRRRSGIGYYIYSQGNKVRHDEERDRINTYEYKLTDSNDFIDYLSYLMLFIIMLFIIYLFNKVFLEGNKKGSNFDYLNTNID